MEQLPKSVRERLRFSAAGDHPDPDLLAAFVEQSLPEAERTTVLEHLSRCAECREVVALAAGAAERAPADVAPATAPAEESPRAPGRSWLRPPVLGWAAVAVGVLLAAGLVAHYEWNPAKLPPTNLPIAANQNRSASPPSAKTQPEVAQNSSREQEPATHPRAARGTAPGLAARARENRRAAFANGPVASARLRGGATPAAKKAVRTEALASKAPNVLGQAYLGLVPAKPGAISGQSSSGAPAKAMTQVSRSAQSFTVEDYVPAPPGKAGAQNAPTVSVGAGSAGGVVGGVAGGVMGGVSGGAPAVPPPPILTLKETLQTTPMQWTLSADGILERSSDAGKTWTTMEVGEGYRFRALSAIGPDVWVGGANGLLFHSADAGAHWTRVHPVANGSSLKSTVKRIEFTNVLHGRLVTSKGAVWITSDAGLTWQKQRE